MRVGGTLALLLHPLACLSFEKQPSSLHCLGDDWCESGLCVISHYTHVESKYVPIENCSQLSGPRALFCEGLCQERFHLHDGAICFRNEQCAGRHCVAGICQDHALLNEGDPCNADDECQSGHCILFTCRAKQLAQGKDCFEDSDCATGLCVGFKNRVLTRLGDTILAAPVQVVVQREVLPGRFVSMHENVCKDESNLVEHDQWCYKHGRCFEHSLHVLQTGDYCERDTECNSSICLLDQCRESAVGVLRNGEICDHSQQCESGHCFAKHCGPLRQNGQHCRGDNSCESGLCVSSIFNYESSASIRLVNGSRRLGAGSFTLENCSQPPGSQSKPCHGHCHAALALENGAICYRDVQCSSKLCIAGYCREHAQVSEGEACTENSQCDTGSCVLFKCQTKRLRLGAGCFFDSDCGTDLCVGYDTTIAFRFGKQNVGVNLTRGFASTIHALDFMGTELYQKAFVCDNLDDLFVDDGTWCYKHGYCVNQTSRVLGAGDYCSGDADCVSGHCISDMCREKGEAVLEDGEPCEADRECKSRHCISRACSPLQPSGGTCNKNSDCETGRCLLVRTWEMVLATGTCHDDLLEDGAHCEGDTDCAGGHCVASRCKERAVVDKGERCFQNSDCSSNNCSTRFKTENLSPRHLERYILNLKREASFSDTLGSVGLLHRFSTCYGLDNGEACVRDDMCVSGHCVAGHCRQHFSLANCVCNASVGLGQTGASSHDANSPLGPQGLPASITQTPSERAGAPSSAAANTNATTQMPAEDDAGKLFPGATKPFPKHWGEPPKVQTMDFLEWPAGYGHGSGTIASWIQKNLDKDVADQLFPGATKPFPQHWGAPPKIQTMDFREWPAGYGHGSGTIATWIQTHLDKDARRNEHNKTERNAAMGQPGSPIRNNAIDEIFRDIGRMEHGLHLEEGGLSRQEEKPSTLKSSKGMLENSSDKTRKAQEEPARLQSVHDEFGDISGESHTKEDSPKLQTTQDVFEDIQRDIYKDGKEIIGALAREEASNGKVSSGPFEVEVRSSPDFEIDVSSGGRPESRSSSGHAEVSAPKQEPDENSTSLATHSLAFLAGACIVYVIMASKLRRVGRELQEHIDRHGGYHSDEQVVQPLMRVDPL